MAQPLMQKRMEDEAKQFQTMQKGAPAPDLGAPAPAIGSWARWARMRAVNQPQKLPVAHHLSLLASCPPGRRVVRATVTASHARPHFAPKHTRERYHW